jgi:GAF domain-containing protein
MPLQIILTDFLVAVLAAWLGATVLSRTRREYPQLVFGVLTLLAATWGISRVIYRVSGDGSIRAVSDSVTAGVATLLPAALLHMVLAYTVGRRTSRAQLAVLVAAYASGLVIGYLSVSDRTRAIAISEPNRGLLGVSGIVVGWGWIIARAAVMAMAIWWAWRAWRAEGADGLRRGQLTATLAAVSCGAIGGIVGILGRQFLGPDRDWPGGLLIAASLGLASYGIFGQRIFLSPSAARRSFLNSVGTGLATAAYVTLVLLLDRLVRTALEIPSSIFTAVALVLTLALFDPAREQIRSLLDRRSGSKDLARRRLMRMLGGQMLGVQRPEAALGPALERLSRALGTRAAAVLDPQGRAIAAYGQVPAPGAQFPVVLPMTAGDHNLGSLVLGKKRDRLPYSSEEMELLHDAAAFMGASLRLAEQQSAQAKALEALTREQAALASRETQLAGAIESADDSSQAAQGLRVSALGPLHVERGDEPIRRWGGAKAGTRQAEAMFAFLFDRGERGVAKDEFLEVIWPDVPLENADLAFHRTLGGLRRTLETGLQRAGHSTFITYQNDRYRLGDAAIAWSDVSTFEELISGAASSPDGAIPALEEARKLYRGPYLDDCPFYGDSEYVEEHRRLLEGRRIDLLLALGELYETAGDNTAAAGCYRQALQAAGDDCPRADDGLARLGLPL